MTQQASPPPRLVALPLGSSAYVASLLIALNISMFLLETLAGGSQNPCTLIRFGAKFNVLIQQGQYWRLVTPIFLHIGLSHLLFNQYALWILGREVEQLFGSARFAVLYLLTGMWGNVTSMLFVDAISAGASGAIFGLVGAQLTFLWVNRHVLGEIGRQQRLNLLGIIGLNLIFGVTVPGIDNWNHMGGLASGLLLGAVLAPRYATGVVTPFHVVIVDTNPLRERLWFVAGVIALTVALVPLLAGFAPTSPRDGLLLSFCVSRPAG
ncbi:MAG: rhomboid family intramembrane serine protease [Ardenticatenia bacterium]|nr:rhomboid family intramembrane serine protease [Ardenticatenia bacterium]